MQKPTLKLEDIRRLRSALQDSVRSLKAEWELNLPSPPNAPQYKAGKFRFAMRGALLLHEEKHGKTMQDLVDTYARAFNGKSETVYHGSVLSKQAIVSDFASVSYYFKWHNPLWLAMLVDSKKYLGQSTSGLENFNNRDAYPLEETIHFNGRRCMPFLEQEDVYFLDPTLGYAFCGLEAGRYDYDDKLGRLVENNNYRAVTLEGFQDCGNSLWLPRKFSDTRIINGKASETATVQVTSLEVNQTIDDKYFESIVPSGVEIVNGLNDVQEQLDPTLKSRSWIRTRAMTLSLLIIMLLGLGCLIVVRRRLRKEAE
jgi:hypothetical protein